MERNYFRDRLFDWLNDIGGMGIADLSQADWSDLWWGCYSGVCCPVHSLAGGGRWNSGKGNLPVRSLLSSGWVRIHKQGRTVGRRYAAHTRAVRGSSLYGVWQPGHQNSQRSGNPCPGSEWWLWLAGGWGAALSDKKWPCGLHGFLEWWGCVGWALAERW